MDELKPCHKGSVTGPERTPIAGYERTLGQKGPTVFVYWQESTQAFDDECERLVHVFGACRDAFFATAAAFHWTPVDGSVAAADAARLPSPDPAISSPQGETGHRLIAEVMQTFLMVASHHLGALAALHGRREVFFPPSMLVRAVVENCSHAIWVLGDDPSEPSENRLARAYLEDLLSAEEAKKNAGRMGNKQSQSYVEAKAEYEGIKAEILARFEGATADNLGVRTLSGQTLPALEAGVVAMYELFHRKFGSSIDARRAQGIYGFLSNMTHPTLYPARQLRRWVRDPGHPGELVTTLELDPDFLRRQGSAAVVSFYNTLALVTSYFGWETSIFNGLTAHVEVAFPEALA